MIPSSEMAQATAFGFWTGMFIVTLLLPTAMLILDLLFQKCPSKRINRTYGYHSRLARGILPSVFAAGGSFARGLSFCRLPSC